MTKRTKRYGGFRIGDRVYPKNKKDWRLDEGKVIQLQDGKVFAQFYDCGFTNPVIAFMPNQLINLTRIEEERELEIEERFLAFCGKHNITPPKANFNPAKEIDELKAIRGFVAEALRQTEIFLSPLSPYGDPLPSPYTRDVYTSTKDYE